MNFIIIGESVNRLSSALIEQNSAIPWAQINGLRNIVAHNYFGVDAEEVWQTIQNDLEPLIRQMEKIVEKGKV